MRKEQEVQRLMQSCSFSVLVEVTSQSLFFTPRRHHCPIEFVKGRRDIQLSFNFSSIPTGLPRYSLGGEKGSRILVEKQSLECVILSVAFCSACFPTVVCTRCQCLFEADLLQNSLKSDRTFGAHFVVLLYRNITMCYPHLIPSFRVSIMV